MPVHTLRLATEPFEAITNGRKTIESRLYDEKRKLIQLGDTITFVNRENPKQTADVIVIGLLRYKDFVTMFKHNEPSKFGGESTAWLMKQVSQLYSETEQAQYGVLGIQFQVA